MDLTRTNAILGLALSVLALLGFVLGWLRVVRPRWRRGLSRVGAALDTIAGREAITDNITGKELAPELPSIGKRMESVEDSVARLVDVVESQHHQDEQLADHERRLKQLEDQTIERIAAKAESVSAWRAVEAVAKNVDPTTPAIDAED